MANPMYNAILKWSLAQHDGLSDEPMEAMTEDRKEFLNMAMESMLVNEFKRMKLVVQTLRMSFDISQLRAAASQLGELETYEVKEFDAVSDIALIRMIKTRKEMALFELDDLVGTIDNANDLCKNLGIHHLLAQLSSPFLSIRWRAAQVLSTVVQNNPEGQQAATTANAVPLLLAQLNFEQSADESLLPTGFFAAPEEGKEERSVVHEEDEDYDEIKEVKTLNQKIVTKVILALSSLLRNNPTGTATFLESNGIETLYTLLDHPLANKRIIKKIINVLRYFWQSEEFLVRAGSALPMLIRLMSDPDINLREAALNSVLELLRHPTNLQLVTSGNSELATSLTTTAFQRLKICASYTDASDIDRVRDEKAALDRLVHLLRAANH
jgi:hypothetical protein